jgi:hypothetical protein
MKPKRIQRKRTKGWKMPENTVYVGRGSKWGNPFYIERHDKKYFLMRYKYYDEPKALAWSYCINKIRKEAVIHYKDYIHYMIGSNKLDIAELKGKNLACWCALDQPCHADVLLELANKEEK